MATLPDIVLTSNVYVDVNTLTGIPVGTPMVINNKGSGSVLIQIRPTAPLNSSQDGVQLVGFGFFYVDANEGRVWLKGQAGRINVQEA